MDAVQADILSTNIINMPADLIALATSELPEGMLITTMQPQGL